MNPKISTVRDNLKSTKKTLNPQGALNPQGKANLNKKMYIDFSQQKKMYIAHQSLSN